MLPQPPFSQVPAYFWRDYTGKIPYDAVPGGVGVDGEPIYIGHVFFRSKSAIIPAAIHRNQVEIFFEKDGVNKTENVEFVQILCSNDKYAFRWIPVDENNFQTQTIGQTLVRGGLEDGKIVNIGRIQYQGETAIGKIVSFIIGGAKMWFVHNKERKSSTQYEVLAVA